MNGELLQVVEQVGREKGIDTEIIIAALEDAIVMAAKKFHRTNEELVSQLDRQTGVLKVFAQKRVVKKVADPDLEISLAEARKLDAEAQVEGVVRIPRSTEGLGRIAAQAAKQVIYQKVREAERDLIFAEYSERIGEVVTGIVKRFEKGDMIVDLGKTEAVCPKRDQARHESYRQEDRLRAVIIEVNKSAKGPQVVISRTSPELLKHLFEMEVPEIYDGTIRIVQAVREPGERAKVAVISKERDVDPVGACVGMKGVRVQSIIRELRGEKIDIVQYSPDTTTFATNALNPAKVNRVRIVNEEQKILEVVVDDSQLSLAIGKRGQNVRLAAKLLGWRIDIKSEEEKRREVEMELERGRIGHTSLEEVEGFGGKTLERLRESGFETVGQVAAAGADQLCQIPGIGPKTSVKLFEQATGFIQEELNAFLAEKLAEEEEYEEFLEPEAGAPAAGEAAAEGAAAEESAAAGGSPEAGASEPAGAAAETGGVQEEGSMEPADEVAEIPLTPGWPPIVVPLEEMTAGEEGTPAEEAAEGGLPGEEEPPAPGGIASAAGLEGAVPEEAARVEEALPGAPEEESAEAPAPADEALSADGEPAPDSAAAGEAGESASTARPANGEAEPPAVEPAPPAGAEAAEGEEEATAAVQPQRRIGPGAAEDAEAAEQEAAPGPVTPADLREADLPEEETEPPASPGENDEKR